MKKVCGQIKDLELNNQVFKDTFLKELGAVTLINFLEDPVQS